MAVHFLEEAPGFAQWARRNISPLYSDAHWRRIHALGFLCAVAAAAAVSLWTRPVSVFLFTALFLTPMVFNSLFHLGASLFYRSYSPGAFSALLLFPAAAAAKDLCPRVRFQGRAPKLDEVEKRLVCGDPGSDAIDRSLFSVSSLMTSPAVVS